MSDAVFRHRRMIVKGDDFGRGPLVDPWRRFLDVCLDRGVVPSLGIVGKDFSRNDRVQRLARYFQDALGVEFWNHSFSHQDMRRLTPEERRRDTLAAQEAIGSVLGKAPRVYGAPFNLLDLETAAEIQQAGDFDTFYFGVDGAGASNIPADFLIAPEISTQCLRPINFSYFKYRYAQRKKPWAVVLQVHPTYWSKDCFGEFDRVLAHLLSDEYQGVTAREFRGSLPGAPRLRADALDVGALLTVTETIYQASTEDLSLGERMSGPDRAYYFGRLRRGSTPISRFLQQFALAPSAGEAGPFRFVDVGAGVANWAMAAKAADNTIEAFAIDSNGELLKYMEAALSGLVDGEVCRFVCCPAEDMPFATESVHAVVCNNALNYMNAPAVLREVARICRSGGLSYFGLQNELYPVLDLLRHVAARDDAGALGRVDRIVMNEARRQGVSGAPSFIAYWNDFEFIRLAHHAGLEPLVRGTEPPEDHGRLLNVPVLWGYLLIRTAQSLERGARLRAGDGATALDLTALIAAGASEAAWTLAAAAPSLVEEAGNFAGLLKQAARGGDADAVLDRARAAGVTVPEAVERDLRLTLPLLAADDWQAIRRVYDEDENAPVNARVCASWLAGRRNAVPPRDLPAAEGWLSAVVDVGRAIALGERSDLARAVGRLFDELIGPAHLTRVLMGDDPRAETLPATSESDPEAIAAERRLWLSRIEAPFAFPG